MPDPMNAVMARAYLQPDGELPLWFAFNPTELAMSQTAEWQPATTPRANTASHAQFRATQPRSLSVEIFFDRSIPRAATMLATDPASPSVQGDVERLLAMTVPKPDSNPPKPPTVTFGWGLLEKFRGHVKSVQATYLLFGRAGYPYRAKARVELGQLQDPTPGQNPTSGAERARRTHRIAPGDTLQSVAYASYGDPRLWRGLATVNDLDDPLRLDIGSELLLPEEDELADLS